MTGFVKELRSLAGADVGALARALAGEPGLAALAGDARGALAARDVRFSFVAASPVDVCESWLPPPSADVTLGWAGFSAAPRWIGALPYEAGRGLERAAWVPQPDRRDEPLLARPRWLRFDAVLRIDHESGAVVVEADDAAAADRLVRRISAGLERANAPRTFGIARLAADEREELHATRIRQVLELIAAGDVYQVNLARRIACEVGGDRLELFLALRRAAPAPYGFYADLGAMTVCASSPELALEVRGDRMRSAPIKGTRPRGADAVADGVHAAELDADAKERAELTMAIDLHRNDLGRVAIPGSVRVLGDPRVLPGRTVWSRVAEVVARRRPGVELEEVVQAVFPCGSVTGAPKVRAMEVIACLEPHRRGLYTGAFGYVGRDGALVLAVAIRTLEVAATGLGHYWTGGGIVADSDPARELDETRWKAAQLETLESWPNDTSSSTGRQT